MESYLTTGQVAYRLGVTRRAVGYMIARGELPAERVGHGYLVPSESLPAPKGEDGNGSGDLLTLAEAAVEAGVSVWTMREWTQTGRIPAVTVRGKRGRPRLHVYRRDLDPQPHAERVMVPASRYYLSTAEAAGYLGVSRRTVHSMIDRGELKHVQVGRSLRIPRESLVLHPRYRARRPEKKLPPTS